MTPTFESRSTPHESLGHLPGYLFVCLLCGLATTVLPWLYSEFTPMIQDLWGPLDSWSNNSYVQQFRPTQSRLFLWAHGLVLSPLAVFIEFCVLGLLFPVQGSLRKPVAGRLLGWTALGAIGGSIFFVLVAFSMLVGPLIVSTGK